VRSHQSAREKLVTWSGDQGKVCQVAGQASGRPTGEGSNGYRQEKPFFTSLSERIEIGSDKNNGLCLSEI
jgi:hypothetical protein